MDDKNEVWKSIEGMPISYKISNLGNLHIDYGDHVVPIDIKYNSMGEAIVYIGGKQHRVHRLVAKAFLSTPTEKSVVVHIDGNLKNNAVSNLKWVSYAESTKMTYNAGKLRGTRVYCKETDTIYGTIQTAAACTQTQICAVEYGLANGVRMYGYTFLPVGDHVPYDDKIVYLTKQQIIDLGKTLSSPEEIMNVR